MQTPEYKGEVMQYRHGCTGTNNVPCAAQRILMDSPEKTSSMQHYSYCGPAKNMHLVRNLGGDDRKGMATKSRIQY